MMFKLHKHEFDPEDDFSPPSLTDIAGGAVELTTTINPVEGFYRNRQLNWCFVSQQMDDKDVKEKLLNSDNGRRRQPEDEEDPNQKKDPPVNLKLVSDYDKIIQGISTKDFEQHVKTLDIARLATYKNSIKCSSRLTYFLLTIATILIGIFTEFDQIGLYYYLFIRKTLSSDNNLIVFLSLYGCVTFHCVLLVQAFLVGGCCKCFTMTENWTFATSDCFPVFRFLTCHLGVAGNKFMKSREERGEAPETDQERRERQNAQIIIKWWMLVPGFRPLIILLSQGNPDQALQYKSIQDLQIEKNQTYRAFAVMGQLNLVTSTIPCAIIGVMMTDWSNPTDDVAQLVFVGMALCSATLSVTTMCFGVIDGLVNTIDTMDRSLNDYRAQQKSMRETITFAKQHFDDITTLSDDLGLVLARFRSLPGFNPTRTTPIISSGAVSAIAACRASINAFVCEDCNQLELVNKVREQIHDWLYGGDDLNLRPEAYRFFEMLKGDLMKWTMQYATHLERALESVDNMTLNDSEFDRVREMLEEKQGQWNHVAETSTKLFHYYNPHKTFANIISGCEKKRGIPGIHNVKCTLKCSCKKPLEHFKADHDRYMCNLCDEYKPLFADLYGCRDCDVDICQLCLEEFPDWIKEDDEEILCEEDGDQSNKRSALRSESIAHGNKRVPRVEDLTE